MRTHSAAGVTRLLPLVHASIGWPAPLRFTIALVVVVGCGIPMGFPLALGVRALGASDPQSVAWGWGLNAAASVVGACVIMIVMVFAGSPATLLLGAACYGLAALTGRTFSSTAGAVAGAPKP